MGGGVGGWGNEELSPFPTPYPLPVTEYLKSMSYQKLENLLHKGMPVSFQFVSLIHPLIHGGTV